MAATKPIPTTQRSLPIALLRARERVMGPIRAMLTDVGVTEQQWRVLRVLNEAGPMDPTRIAERACLLLPSLTRILQKLEEKGMITREADMVDRRRLVVAIAQPGVDLIEANLDTSVAIMARLRTRMGADRYEALLDLLHDLDEIDMDQAG